MGQLRAGLVGNPIVALCGKTSADHMTGRYTMVPQDPRASSMAGSVLQLRQSGRTLQGPISGARFMQQQQRVQSGLAQQYSHYIRGVETYVDRISGERVELASGHGRAWSNGRGEYILSNDPNFNPSVVFRERWEETPRLERPR